ncbi:hypothetical protein BKA62DRAFT_772314 [Auriculariales sp. MPI-PUGE-AT-0066]|nr:hypothetical protein BKA62DRAFT_772314 [Auriculariales sp. MPI-PUGE-AT-0066]
MHLSNFPREFHVDSTQGHQTLIAFIVLHTVAGLVLLPILCATFAFARVKRHPILPVMSSCLVPVSFLGTLLFYADRTLYDTPLSMGLLVHSPVCLTQAALLYHPVPPMMAVAIAVLLLHLWNTVRDATTSVEAEKPKPWKLTSLLLAPFVAFVVFALASTLMMANDFANGRAVIKLRLYCKFEHNGIAIVRAVFTGLVLVVTACCAGRISMRLFHLSPGMENAAARAALFRVTILFAYVVLGIVLCVVSVFSFSPIADLYLATIPMVVFLLFASPKDVLKAWCFWK